MYTLARRLIGAAALDGTGLLITRVDDISDHYSRTLSLWRTRFLERADTVRAMGFDDRFVRMWEYYLALSEAGFDTGVTQDPADRLREAARHRLTAGASDVCWSPQATDSPGPGFAQAGAATGRESLFFTLLTW